MPTNIKMTDIKTQEERSLNMAKIRSKNTKPEVWLRGQLFRRGYRYRKNAGSITGHPDIWLRKYDTAVFVNGCFWPEAFAFTKCDDDVHEAKGDVIELLPVIFQLILMEVPLKIVKEGAVYPKGNGWEVMREETWQREKSSEIDPRLAKLKEFKVTDDEAGGANNGSTTKT